MFVNTRYFYVVSTLSSARQMGLRGLVAISRGEMNLWLEKRVEVEGQLCKCFSVFLGLEVGTIMVYFVVGFLLAYQRIKVRFEGKLMSKLIYQV